MVKITEATQPLSELYSFRSLIMPQHELRHSAKSLEEILDQSAPRMLAWATRWKMEMY